MGHPALRQPLYLSAMQDGFPPRGYSIPAQRDAESTYRHRSPSLTLQTSDSKGQRKWKDSRHSGSTYRVPEEPPVDLQLHVFFQEADVSSCVSGQFLQGEKTSVATRPR